VYNRDYNNIMYLNKSAVVVLFGFYRPRIHVRDGLQHVQLLRRRDHLHEETLRTRDSKCRVPVQTHRTAVQLCPTPRARLWFQRQHVPQLVFGQVSTPPRNPRRPAWGGGGTGYDFYIPPPM